MKISNSTGFHSLLAIPVFGLLACKYNRQIFNKQREMMQTYSLTESKYIDSFQGIKLLENLKKRNENHFCGSPSSVCTADRFNLCD